MMEEGSIHVDAWILYAVSIVLVNVHNDVILSNYNTANHIYYVMKQLIRFLLICEKNHWEE